MQVCSTGGEYGVSSEKDRNDIARSRFLIQVWGPCGDFYDYDCLMNSVILPGFFDMKLIINIHGVQFLIVTCISSPSQAVLKFLFV